jgi:hypothetical protein
MGQQGTPMRTQRSTPTDRATGGKIEFISQVTVHDAEPELIADVTAFANYAYLARFGGADCAGPEGGGVVDIDVSDPANPREVGFIRTHQGTLVGEGMQVVHVTTPKFTGDVLVLNREGVARAPAAGHHRGLAGHPRDWQQLLAVAAELRPAGCGSPSTGSAPSTIGRSTLPPTGPTTVCWSAWAPPTCAAVSGGRQVHHLSWSVSRHRHGPGAGGPADRRAHRPDGSRRGSWCSKASGLAE